MEKMLSQGDTLKDFLFWAVKGGAMKDHRGGEKLCLSHKSCRHSGCRMSARLGTGRIVDAASRDEPRAGLAVTADTR